MFESKDGFSWNFKSILAQNNGKFGKMWECPDLFELDGKAVLIVSPMEMEAEGLEYQMVTVLYARSEPTTMRQEPLHVSMHRLLIMVLIFMHRSLHRHQMAEES